MCHRTELPIIHTEMVHAILLLSQNHGWCPQTIWWLNNFSSTNLCACSCLANGICLQGCLMVWWSPVLIECWTADERPSSSSLSAHTSAYFNNSLNNCSRSFSDMFSSHTLTRLCSMSCLCKGTSSPGLDNGWFDSWTTTAKWCSLQFSLPQLLLFHYKL